MLGTGASVTLMHMSNADGWPALFGSAFRQSRNAMVLLDEHRRIVDANAAMVALVGRPRTALLGRLVFEMVADGPLATEAEWQAWLAAGRFTGTATMRHADAIGATVQWGATTEVATGRRLVLVVALHTSRWGAQFRRATDDRRGVRALSPREREVVRLVAEGQTGPEIADELGISHDTVRTHVRNAMDKYGARSRAHLVAKAIGDEPPRSPGSDEAEVAGRA
jgi:DNA-binding CsgD family transcriptional regulator